jgi:hypothetical protein
MLMVILFLFLAAAINAQPSQKNSDTNSFIQQNKKPTVDCYISVGDNWRLGESLAVDSSVSIDSAFDKHIL